MGESKDNKLERHRKKTGNGKGGRLLWEEQTLRETIELGERERSWGPEDRRRSRAAWEPGPDTQGRGVAGEDWRQEQRKGPRSWPA